MYGEALYYPLLAKKQKKAMKIWYVQLLFVSLHGL